MMGRSIADERAQATEPAGIELRDIVKMYDVGGKQVNVLDHVDLVVPHGSFVALVGPSGCGKSTVLRILAGLTTADAGKSFIDGQSPEAIRGARKLGIAFQDPALLPWRSVTANIRLPLEVTGAKIPDDAIERLIELVEVDVADALPQCRACGRIRFEGLGGALRPELRALIPRVEGVRAEYARRLAAQQEGLAEICGAANFGLSTHHTDQPPETALIGLYTALSP